MSAPHLMLSPPLNCLLHEFKGHVALFEIAQCYHSVLKRENFLGFRLSYTKVSWGLPGRWLEKAKGKRKCLSCGFEAEGARIKSSVHFLWRWDYISSSLGSFSLSTSWHWEMVSNFSHWRIPSVLTAISSWSMQGCSQNYAAGTCV